MTVTNKIAIGVLTAFFKKRDLMHNEDTRLPGMEIFTPKRFGDEREFFSESLSRKVLAEHGIDLDFLQYNHSLSAEVETVRDLHFEAPPDAQDKLDYCGQGALFDVAVDIRKRSLTYDQWSEVEHTAENCKQLLVLKGFRHGFSTPAPNTEIIYKCTDCYAPQSDGAGRIDDPDIGIDWGLKSEGILSDKDAAAPLLKDFDSPYADLITHVKDRPGHDERYAIHPTRIREELGWRPSVTVEEGLRRTVQWYLDNKSWWRALQNCAGVGQRLGMSG